MADDSEKFLSRWSRLKGRAREQAENPEPPKPASPADATAPPPDLPPVEKLDFDSDYRAFFHPKVDEDTRRAALKKLFSDARFNVIDEMDIDIEDYSKYAPLSAAVVASLKQTGNILQWAREREEEERRREAEKREGQLAKNQEVQPETAPAEIPAAAATPPAEQETRAGENGPESSGGDEGGVKKA